MKRTTLFWVAPSGQWSVPLRSAELLVFDMSGLFLFLLPMPRAIQAFINSNLTIDYE